MALAKLAAQADMQGHSFQASPASAKKRKTSSISSDPEPPSPKAKKKRGSRVNKGLRHFSIKVCEKLSQTGETTYNEIAELLVAESRPSPQELAAVKGYDEKNIRRRIYDALNVLMAMDIIQKDKKKIRWQGIKFADGNNADSASDSEAARETPNLKNQKEETLERIHKKKQLLEEMTYEFIARKTLIERNGKPESLLHHKDKLHRPFIIINTSPVTEVTCEMSDDRTNVHFTYSDSFSIHDNHVILKEIGMQTSPDLVPTELRPFLPSRFPQQASLDRPSSRHSSKEERSSPEAEGEGDELPTLATPPKPKTEPRFNSRRDDWQSSGSHSGPNSPVPYKTSSSSSSSSKSEFASHATSSSSSSTAPSYKPPAHHASSSNSSYASSNSSSSSSSASLSSYLPFAAVASPSKSWSSADLSRMSPLKASSSSLLSSPIGPGYPHSSSSHVSSSSHKLQYQTQNSGSSEHKSPQVKRELPISPPRARVTDRSHPERTDFYRTQDPTIQSQSHSDLSYDQQFRPTPVPNAFDSQPTNNYSHSQLGSPPFSDSGNGYQNSYDSQPAMLLQQLSHQQIHH
eukprot:g74174.t1